MVVPVESTGFRFLSPCSILVNGASGSGKSYFVLNLLKRPDLFELPISEVIWYHGVTTASLPSGPNIRTIEGMPDITDIQNLTRNDRSHRLVVLDDLLTETMSNKEAVAEMWTRISHHSNITFILLTQSLFDTPRLVRNNTHYLVLFKPLLDKLNVISLGRQIFPDNLKFFLSCVDDATSKPFGFIIISAHPRENQDHLRLSTDIFSVQKVYLPAKMRK